MIDKVADNVYVIQLSNYTSPQVKEDLTGGQQWVSYGEENDYYQHLIDRFLGSPTNNACITGIAQLIYGEGLEATDEQPAQLTVLKSIFTEDLLKRTAIDLKLLGAFAWQVSTTRQMVKHIAVENLRAEKADELGNIKAYYYSDNWKEPKGKYKPRRIPAYGFATKKDTVEVLVTQPYQPGCFYYTPPDYQGGLQYAELEEEVSNFHLNNIKNGLAPGMLVNFNNGIPDEAQRQEIENKIQQKFKGSSNAGRLIVAFNADKESAATIDPVQLSDADKQYQFLSDESQRKILVAHRITSPMLLGIKDNTGLGNNADELKTAFVLFENTVIMPYRILILDTLKKIVKKWGATLDLYFKTLKPLDFVDIDEPVTEQEREKETGVKMASHDPPPLDMTDDQELDWLEFLESKGEVPDPDYWQIVEEVPVDDPAEELRYHKFFKEYADPQNKSRMTDSGLYKIRYRYSPKRTQANSRVFCVKMVDDAKKGTVYRVEDILEMSRDGVNSQFSPRGESTYNIWLYKGGVNCHHFWTRVVYFRKRDGGKFKPASKSKSMENDETVSSEAARKDVPKRKFNPTGWNKAKTKPKDMPNSGRKN